MRKVPNYRTTNAFTDLFDMFNGIFEDTIGFIPSVEPKFNKLMSSGEWPPANIIVDKTTKELTIEVGLVGCTEDNIQLTFDGDYLKLVVRSSIETKDDSVFIQRGLRKIGNVQSNWKIDPRFYDADNVFVEFKNGLLTIKLYPKADCKPRKVNLFGRYEEKPKIEEEDEE